jgi:hypothetical protein
VREQVALYSTLTGEEPAAPTVVEEPPNVVELRRRAS